MLTGAVPSFFAGQLADRFGRLSVVSFGALVFLVGAILQGAANKLAMLLVGRALGGLGEGLWISCISVYSMWTCSVDVCITNTDHFVTVTEIAPSTRRGMLVSMPQLMACTGICSGYL